MSGFLTDLQVVEVSDIADSGRGLWKLTAPLVYQSDLLGKTITVPAGTLTDFASVPRLPFAFWLVGDSASRPAALHDALYQRGSGLVPDRATADALLREAALSEGVPTWRVALLFLGVRTFGASHWQT